MNLIVRHFVSGEVFFAGMLAVVAAAAFIPWARQRTLRRALPMALIVGAILVILSAAPQPPALYAAWLVAMTALLAFANRQRLTVSGGTALVYQSPILVLSLLLLALEAPYVRMKPSGHRPGQTLYVIGDSISAGMGGREKTWPDVLAEKSGARVVNLAEAGATAASAMGQAERIAERGATVVVEIGGNDMLDGTGTEAFGRDLDALLLELRKGDHAVIMLELPLPPFHNAYGRIQRRLARKHLVTLMPKRHLAMILATEGATLDGLHLSQIGHDLMAETIGRALGLLTSR